MSKYLMRLAIGIAVAGLLMGCAGAPAPKAPPPSMQPQMVSTEGYVQTYDAFYVILDTSGSMKDVYKGDTEINHARDVVALLNHTIPQSLKLTAGLRAYGRIGGPLSQKRSELFYGVTDWTRAGFDEGLMKAPTWANGATYMGQAILAAEEDLAGMGKRVALIIVSDGVSPDDSPLDEVKMLKGKFGDGFCVYTIHVGEDKAGKKLMEQIADAGGCGFATSVDRELSPSGMAEFVRAVFLAKAPAKPAPPAPKAGPVDSDGDGVMNSVDACPFTPKGAKVDAQGCWVTPMVWFDFDEAAVKGTYYDELDQVAEVVKNNSGLTLTIHGYTCNMGPADYNMMLSRNRANNVMGYLAARGVAKNRMVVQAHGFNDPVASNATKEGRMKNRRVEIEPSTR
jgi:OOP family OmpA-OmpF porin